MKLDHLDLLPQVRANERLLQVLVLGDHRLPGSHHLVHGVILVIVERFVQTRDQETLIQTAYDQIEEKYSGQQCSFRRVFTVSYGIAKILEESEEFLHYPRNFRRFNGFLTIHTLGSVPVNTMIVRGSRPTSEQRAEMPYQPPQQRDHDVVGYQYEPQASSKREEEDVHVWYEAVIGHHEAYLVLVQRRCELKLLETAVSLDEKSRDAHVGYSTLYIVDQERVRVPFDVPLPHRFYVETRAHSLLEDEQRFRVYFIQLQPVPPIVRDSHKQRFEHGHVHGIMIQILKILEQPPPISFNLRTLAQTSFVHDAVLILAVPLERFVPEHATKIVVCPDHYHPVRVIPFPQRSENVPPNHDPSYLRSLREHDQVLIVRVPHVPLPVDEYHVETVDREQPSDSFHVVLPTKEGFKGAISRRVAHFVSLDRVLPDVSENSVDRARLKFRQYDGDGEGLKLGGLANKIQHQPQVVDLPLR